MNNILVIMGLLSLCLNTYAESKHGIKGTEIKVATAKELPIKKVVAKVLNPVSLDIDEHGNVYVVETIRYLGNGDFDNRGKKVIENLDQSIVTMADHEDAVRQLFKQNQIPGLRDKSEADLHKYLTKHKERIWKFWDSNGDGQLDKKSLFYEGFNTINSGIAAGVLARHGKVYVTAEPEVWVFEDRDGDHKADHGKLLSTGFAVKIGWFGHDLHGLVHGPDGKIYFSIADKGWHVTTQEGKVLANNNTGGVFRCNPDGSELEEYAVGLRNPQELAFDAYGNLFSGDNNCDAGDKARLVYITEGSDSGWRFSHQSLNSRGPWLREKMWQLRESKEKFNQPQWITPPI
ncbi:MAG: PQQ-dependent sugar dehydrogenase, partial [Lentisphaeraceae bacterium]|nr:PQQ-dependent sugar dehydrogenase [Lentisphaeraceae bacterium]